VQSSSKKRSTKIRGGWRIIIYKKGKTAKDTKGKEYLGDELSSVLFVSFVVKVYCHKKTLLIEYPEWDIIVT
jgi:hypothetical protein